MTVILELQPDKSLLNPNFEKYQFSAETLPTENELVLDCDVLRIEPNGNQDSWLEVRIFAFHNHLFNNLYDTSSWYIDKNSKIWRFSNNGELVHVHTMNSSHSTESNVTYNPSIGFTSHGIAAIFDGKNTLELLIEHVKGKTFILEKVDPGIIMNVQYISEKSMLMIAICSIEDDNGKKYSQITLLSYIWENQNSPETCFRFSSKEILKVKGAVEYVYIEKNANHLHTICQDSITFENSILNKDNENSKIKIPKYCWSQDKDSITIWLKISEKYSKENAEINVTPTNISIVVNGKILIEGECQHRLEENLTTWVQEGDTLKIDLVKFETGLMWNELIKGDTGGECLPNETLAAEIHSRLAHLCTDHGNMRGDQPVLGFNAEQLEECDVQGRDNLLQRINLVTQETTHLAILGTNNQILFTYMKENGQAICLRHDHDGCVWITDQFDNDQWNMKHMSTFPGFGYVEASKSNKKFCISPPDASYVAIVEHTRHIFIYEKPSTGSNVGKQKIIDLGPDSSVIMGAVSVNNHLIILTQNKLYQIQLYV